MPNVLEDPSSVLQDDEIAHIRTVQYGTVHKLIDQILAKIPLAPAVLEKEIKLGFPTKTAPSENHADYVDNILKIAGTSSNFYRVFGYKSGFGMV